MRYKVSNAGFLNVKLLRSVSFDRANPMGNAIITKMMLKPILFFIPINVCLINLSMFQK